MNIGSLKVGRRDKVADERKPRLSECCPHLYNLYTSTGLFLIQNLPTFYSKAPFKGGKDYGEYIQRNVLGMAGKGT